MNKSAIDTKYVYAIENVVYEKASAYQNEDTNVWFPVNFYWKSTFELRQEMRAS